MVVTGILVPLLDTHPVGCTQAVYRSYAVRREKARRIARWKASIVLQVFFVGDFALNVCLPSCLNFSKRYFGTHVRTKEYSTSSPSRSCAHTRMDAYVCFCSRFVGFVASQHR